MMHSYYSLCYGTMSVEGLVERASDLGYGVLPLTDINTTMGVPDLVFACREKGIRPVAGVEIRNGDTLCYTALARNNLGYGELNAFLTQHNLSRQPYPSTARQWTPRRSPSRASTISPLRAP